MIFKVDLLPEDPHPSKHRVQKFISVCGSSVGITAFPKQKYPLVDLEKNVPLHTDIHQYNV